MKLIDILVRELPKRGGWPADAKAYVQYAHGRTVPTMDALPTFRFGCWGLGGPSINGAFQSEIIAEDWNYSVVTLQQYESALASHASQIAPMGTVGDAVAEAVTELLELAAAKKNPYLREIKPGVWVDVYDVLNAWCVTNPALQHLLKKALQPGERGHKSREQDLQDIIDSAIRAKELEIGK